MARDWDAEERQILADLEAAERAMRRNYAAVSPTDRRSPARVNMVDAAAHNRRATDLYIEAKARLVAHFEDRRLNELAANIPRP